MEQDQISNVVLKLKNAIEFLLLLKNVYSKECLSCKYFFEWSGIFCDGQKSLKIMNILVD